VSGVGIPSCPIPITMLDSKSLNTLFPNCMIASKHENVFICGLSNLILQIIFDTWWVSMDVGLKWHNAWNGSRHVSSWQLYLHCGIDKSSSLGIICIVCHQVLHHPSEHETSTMGKHSLAKAHIAISNKLTGSEVTELTNSMADEPALAILMKHGTWECQILSWQRKFIFHIQVGPYWLKWQTTCAKLAANDFETSEFHNDTSNRYLIFLFVLAYIPYKAIWILKQPRSFKPLRSDLVLLSVTTLRKIRGSEYLLTVDAIKEQLPLQNNLSLALDGWTSTNKLATM